MVENKITQAVKNHSQKKKEKEKSGCDPH